MQQDITRGRQMTDSLFQGGQSQGGTHNAILSSEDYLSQAKKDLSNIEDGFYIAPLFLDKLSIHVAKNFLDLPKIKVPLILGTPAASCCTSQQCQVLCICHSIRLGSPLQAGAPAAVGSAGSCASVTWYACAGLRQLACSPSCPLRHHHMPCLLQGQHALRLPCTG